MKATVYESKSQGLNVAEMVAPGRLGIGWWALPQTFAGFLDRFDSVLNHCPATISSCNLWGNVTSTTSKHFCEKVLRYNIVMLTNNHRWKCCKEIDRCLIPHLPAPRALENETKPSYPCSVQAGDPIMSRFRDIKHWEGTWNVAIIQGLFPQRFLSLKYILALPCAESQLLPEKHGVCLTPLSRLEQFFIPSCLNSSQMQCLGLERRGEEGKRVLWLVSWLQPTTNPTPEIQSFKTVPRISDSHHWVSFSLAISLLQIIK